VYWTLAAYLRCWADNTWGEAMFDVLMAQLARDRSELHYLASTGWLPGATPEELEARYREYSSLHDAACSTLATQLGHPDRSLPGDADWFGAWYPEAFAAALWRYQGKYVCLAAEHHDKEAPVCLALFCLTEQELAARRA
jgi:hypothetical protein